MDGDRESHSRTETAMGERVMRVETKIEGIEKDTTVIRSTMHDFANNMQKFVIQEADCVSSLKQIIEDTKHLPGIIATVNNIVELKPHLESLIKGEQQRTGAWRAMVHFGGAIVGATTVIGGLAGLVLWILHGFSVTTPHPPWAF